MLRLLLTSGLCVQICVWLWHFSDMQCLLVPEFLFGQTLFSQKWTCCADVECEDFFRLPVALEVNDRFKHFYVIFKCLFILRASCTYIVIPVMLKMHYIQRLYRNLKGQPTLFSK